MKFMSLPTNMSHFPPHLNILNNSPQKKKTQKSVRWFKRFFKVIFDTK